MSDETVQAIADRQAAEIARLRAALQKISDTFKRDLDQGYKTKDKAFAIDIADMALKETDP